MNVFEKQGKYWDGVEDILNWSELSKFQKELMIGSIKHRLAHWMWVVDIWDILTEYTQKFYLDEAKSKNHPLQSTNISLPSDELKENFKEVCKIVLEWIEYLISKLKDTSKETESKNILFVRKYIWQEDVKTKEMSLEAAIDGMLKRTENNEAQVKKLLKSKLGDSNNLREKIRDIIRNILIYTIVLDNAYDVNIWMDVKEKLLSDLGKQVKYIDSNVWFDPSIVENEFLQQLFDRIDGIYLSASHDIDVPHHEFNDQSRMLNNHYTSISDHLKTSILQLEGEIFWTDLYDWWSK